MLALSIRNLLSHKLRLFFTSSAVVIGVGFVVGAFVVTDTLRGSIGQLFDEVNATIDVQVRARTDLEGSGGTVSRGRVPVDLVEIVRDVEGVSAADGSIGGYAQLLTKVGAPVTSTGAPFLGVSWGESDALSPVTLDVGRGPQAPGEVAIDADQAREFNFSVGDRTDVLLTDGRQPVEIVGIFTFGDSNSLLGARLVAFDTRTALDVLGGDTGFDTIDIAGDGTVTDDELAARIVGAIPGEYEAVPVTTVVDESMAQVDGFIGVFRTALLVFAGIALFVSAFSINNTFSIILGQRVRELAMLRALGATGGQVVASVVIEAVLVGALASAVGVVVGLGIASLLRAVLSAGGLGLPPGSLVLAPRTFLVAGFVGVVITTVASLAPARRAGKLSPMVALRNGAGQDRDRSGRRALVGSSVTAIGFASAAAGLFAAEGGLTVLALAGGGVLAIFVGVSLLTPLVAGPVARLIGAVPARLGGTASRLARANAARDPFRTARTAAALMIGLALVTTAFVVGSSFKESFSASIEQAVTADYIVTEPTFMGFSPTVVERLEELDEVGAVTAVRFDRFVFEGSERDLVAIDPTTAGELIDVDVRAGSLDQLDDSSIFVHEDPARDLGLSVGDTVSVTFATGGAQELTVAGIHGDATWAGNYFVSLDTMRRWYPANTLDVVAFFKAADGVDPAGIRRAVNDALDDYPQLVLEDRAEFNASQREQVDALLLAVNGLLGLALFIALAGIANTLALSVVERTREIGLLRAVGMTRSQTRRMVTIESGIIAVFGALLGVGLGLVFGWAAASAMPESVVTTIVVPVSVLVVVVVQASVLGVIAGLLPARRAAKLDVLHAIASE